MDRQKEDPITGKEGSPIKLDIAANWTKNYRDRHPGETISQFFGREILEQILAQEKCLGIRFYYAYSKPLNAWQRCVVSISKFILRVIGNIDGEKHLIITGSISDGSDQISEKEPEAMSDTSGAKPAAPHVLAVALKAEAYVLGDQSAPCPGSPGCPHNALTGD
jgi:hypothetical protein